MPIYEYYCEDTQCNHQFEEVLAMSRRDEPIKNPCPECGKKTIKKGVSATTMDKVKKATPRKHHDHLESISDNNAGHLGPR